MEISFIAASASDIQKSVIDADLPHEQKYARLHEDI